MDVVTGATGFLGGVLVGTLVGRGRRVRALSRAGSDVSTLEGEGVEIARGDLLDAASLREAFRGAERVYHAAGQVEFGLGGAEALQAVNVQGTSNVLQACAACGVGRLVYVSSIEALDLAGSRGEVTEAAGFHPGRTVLPYGQSKARASLAVLDACGRGLDAVLVCPTGYIGPFDRRLSAMGRLMVDFVRRRVPVTVDGGFDFVDVRDVAEGTIAAAERGRRGESYILGGSYQTVAGIMAALEARTSVRAPSIVLPPGVALAFARLAEIWYAARSLPPRFTTGSVRLLAMELSVSIGKAREELGYDPRPFGTTLDDALAWLAEAGYLGDATIQEAI